MDGDTTAQNVAPPTSETTDAPLAAVECQEKENAGDADSGEWYFMESTTQQPAGPWTVAQLRARWQRDQINGLTLVWRKGLQGGWKPLAEVVELKDAFRQAAETEDERPAKRRRTALDDIPLTHTYTSDQGVLYVFDTVDEDWKASDVYEALLQEEKSEEKQASDCAMISDPAGETRDSANEGMTPEEQEEALRELFAEAAKGGPGAGPLVQVKDAKRRADKAAAADAAEAAKGNDPGLAAQVLDPETEAKRQKRREYRERKKLKVQAGVFVKAKENPNVYVSGLPPDVTFQELEPLFKRAGVLKLDVDTGSSKIRIYNGEDGKCKGDALVTFANPASVELAVKHLHEHELRPGCRICVQQADFDEEKRDAKLSKDKLKELAASRKPERAKYLAAKNAMKEAVSWSGEMDDGSGRKIIILKHMFSFEEAAKEGKDFYVELTEEVKAECEKIGQVVRVTPLEHHKQGIVCVKFKTSWEAEECIRVMDGRYFDGRTVEASFYDGKTDLKLLGGLTEQTSTSTPAKKVAQPTVPAPNCEAMSKDEAAQVTTDATTCMEDDAIDPAEKQPEKSEDTEYKAMFDEQSSDDEELMIRTE
eukprot:TRINITY_DN42393_c0_g1_i1.p1 TRINITY_DN42393_c0_g1~~TRINITY_DN42393_c0_g1_i1.p1  ORF type:complete len:604 (-),score=175.50 TRINITY_DN42393_c0_g1_i1:55-1833(-)